MEENEKEDRKEDEKEKEKSCEMFDPNLRVKRDEFE